MLHSSTDIIANTCAGANITIWLRYAVPPYFCLILLLWPRRLSDASLAKSSMFINMLFVNAGLVWHLEIYLLLV